MGSYLKEAITESTTFSITWGVGVVPRPAPTQSASVIPAISEMLRKNCLLIDLSRYIHSPFTVTPSVPIARFEVCRLSWQNLHGQQKAPVKCLRLTIIAPARSTVKRLSLARGPTDHRDIHRSRFCYLGRMSVADGFE